MFAAGRRLRSRPEGVSEDPWPQARKTPSNDLFVSDRTGPRSSLTERWTVSLEGESTPLPVVFDGTAYLGDGSSSVYAIDLASGQVTWEQGLDIGIECAPAVFNNTLYVVTNDGRIYTMEPDTGEQQLLGRVPAGDDEATHSPVVVDDTLLVERGRALRAVGLESGEQRWSNEDMFSSTTHGFAVADGYVIYTNRDGKLLAVSLSDGTTQWSRSPDYDGGEFMQTPVVRDGTVYCGSKYTASSTEDGTVGIHALDLADGNQQWRHVYDGYNPLSGVYPVVTSDRVYFDTAAYSRDGREITSYSNLNSLSGAHAPFDGTYFYDLAGFGDALYLKQPVEGKLGTADRFELEGVSTPNDTDLVLLDRAVLFRTEGGGLALFEQESVPTPTQTPVPTENPTPTDTRAPSGETPGGSTERPPDETPGGGTDGPSGRSPGGGTTRPPGETPSGGTARPPGETPSGGTARPPGETPNGGTDGTSNPPFGTQAGPNDRPGTQSGRVGGDSRIPVLSRFDDSGASLGLGIGLLGVLGVGGYLAYRRATDDDADTADNR